MNNQISSELTIFPKNTPNAETSDHQCENTIHENQMQIMKTDSEFHWNTVIFNSQNIQKKQRINKLNKTRIAIVLRRLQQQYNITDIYRWTKNQLELKQNVYKWTMKMEM